MARSNKMRLGDLLVSKGLLEEEQIPLVVEKQKETGEKFGETVLEMGLVTEGDLIDALTEQLGVEYVDVRRIKIDEECTKLVREDYMRKNSVLPYAFDPLLPNVVKVAMADPMDIMVVDDISIMTNFQVDPVLSTKGQINVALDRLFGASQAMQAAEMYRKERQKDKERIGATTEDDTTQGDDEVENSPIVQLVRSILEQGVRRRASDIHIEALEFQVRVRYRIDGALVVAMMYEIDMLPAISARIKIIGGMDISFEVRRITVFSPLIVGKIDTRTS